MLGNKIKTKREDLIQKISNTLSQWPELQRRIFVQAHYHGQSLEAISRSLKLDVDEVSVILKQCDRQLYISLREFCENRCDKAPLIPAETVCLAYCRKDSERGHSLAP